MVTVTGKLQSSANGTAIVGGVEVMLCGYGSRIPRVNDVALIARIQDENIAVQPDGTFTFSTYPNDDISPKGTYYTVTIRDDNSDTAQVNAYRFLSSPPTYDLNLIDPYDPNQPPPSLPPLLMNEIEIVPSSDAMVFDGTQYPTFRTILTGDVTQPTVINIAPGNLYTFIIAQDGAGGHSFTWPPTVYNATLVNPQASSMTIQTFVADENSYLWPIGPGTYFP